MANVIYLDNPTADRSGIADRIIRGEAFVARRELQNFGLMNMLLEASLAGISKSVGPAIAKRVRDIGFERIHEVVAPTDILKITDAVYEEMRLVAPHFLKKYVAAAFPGAGPLYYEQYPNVRFHIPYDLTASHRKRFEGFRGEGKVAAHGPHRDSWLSCPNNGINVWIAMGRVQHGNGLTIFTEDNDRNLSHQPSGDIADCEWLRKPVTFELAPGDAIIFHTDMLHGSELNRTNETRFVISFRLTFGKPRFPNSHVQEYVYAKWIGGPLENFALLPSKLQASYVRQILKRNKIIPAQIGHRLAQIFFENSQKQVTKGNAATAATTAALESERKDGIIDLELSELPMHRAIAVTRQVCVARISETECIAFSRRCPHRGADFANGWMENGEIVCPWHNLHFNAATGESPCTTIPRLKYFACETQEGRVRIDTKRAIAAEKLSFDQPVPDGPVEASKTSGINRLPCPSPHPSYQGR